MAPSERGAPLVPSSEDRTAARLAAAALASHRPEVEQALRDLRALDDAREREGHDPSGLVPLALDLRNATLDDDVAYREAAGSLRDLSHLDPALEHRLDEAVKDDPLALARRRIWEWRYSGVAKVFNAVSEPVASSLLTGGTTSLYSGAMSLARLLAQYYASDPIGLRQRQALAHWRDFRRRHPDAAASQELADDVERAERKLARTFRNHDLRRARKALRAGDWMQAEEYARQALDHAPDDEKAEKVLAEARAGQREQERLRQATLEAGLPGAAFPSDAGLTHTGRELCEALLLPDTPPAELEREARALLDERPDGYLADEASFALALAEREEGHESAAWERLHDLADGDPARSNMARHARALLADPWSNAHEQFHALRWRGRRRWLAWLVFGRFTEGPTISGVPRVVGYTLDLPAVARTAATTPIRLLQYPWLPTPDFQRSAAAAARRYLAQQPHGEYAHELADWLQGYEEGRGNWIGVLRALEARDDADPQALVEAREKAAAQALSVAERQTRRDAYQAMLREVVREFPRTRAARLAGERARQEVETASAQHIRLSRGFLEENPRVAGPLGLGLRPQLLDGHTENGELHPSGVTFLGGRTLEFAFVARSGDEDDPPVRVRHEFGEAELARLVSLIDETTLRNAQIDSDDTLGSDAARDLYFERARLGVTSEPDRRATAESRYAYEGVRERYGLVRGRESILPIDLVLQGSLTDFRLGAYPKLREPETTPDAYLYR